MARAKDIKLESEYDAHGLRVRIDRHAGYVAQGTAPDGSEYRTVYSVDYGYLPGVPGDDGDPYDVFVGLDSDFADAFVVDQRSLATGEYEQQKLMWGFKDAWSAEKCFREHRAPEHFGRMGSVPRAGFLAQLAAWRASGSGELFRVSVDYPGEEAPPSSAPLTPEPESARGAMDVEEREREVDRVGRAGQAREHGPAQGGRPGRDAGPAPLYLRTTDVRAVRRETRPPPVKGEPAQDVVVVDFVASDESVDDHDSVVVCDHDLGRFTRNPVLLWAHDGYSLPIGRCENTRVEDGPGGKRLLSTAVFFTRTARQREIAEAYARDECRMFSIGWSAGTYELLDVEGREILRISDNTLLEISACAVGSNANALPTRVVEAARTLARSRHARVSADDVYRSMSERATAAQREDEMNGTKKKVTLPVDQVRAAGGDGMVCSGIACPHCAGTFDMDVRMTPMAPERAADLERRAADAEQRASLLGKEKDSAEARAKSLEERLVKANEEIAKARAARVAAEVDKRVGSKIEPAERDSEVEVCLALDDAKFEERLKKIDARRDLGLLGDPIVRNANAQNGANTAADKEADRPNKHERTTAAQDIRALADG